MPFVLLLGGARGGKSAFAQEMAVRSGAGVTVIATAQARDDEMAERIARHQAARPLEWVAVEEPVELLHAVRSAPEGHFLLVDCLTLWLSNLAEKGIGREAIMARAGAVATALSARATGAVVVSNEVGLGIVPANELARSFRDTVGSVNAVFAAQAERTALMVAGRVQELASTAGFMEGIRWLTPPRG